MTTLFSLIFTKRKVLGVLLSSIGILKIHVCENFNECFSFVSVKEMENKTFSVL